MKMKAIAVFCAVLAVVAVCGCGQSATPQVSAKADAPKTEQAPVTPVTVVEPSAAADKAAAAPEAPAAAPEEKEEPLPEVLAKVGDETITAKDFERKLAFAKKMAMANGMMEAPSMDQKRQLLQSMIREKAVLLLAKSENVTVPDEDVQKEIENTKSRIPAEEFTKRLQEQGISPEELPALVKQSMVVRKLAEARTKDLAASDEEISAEFDRMKAAGKAERKDETTDVAHILIKVPDGADEAAWNDAKTKIDAALKRIQGGEKFADVAKDVSNDPGSRENGGLYMDVRKGQMVPEFEEKMLSTGVGQVSEPFKTKYGWHILTVTAKHAAGPMTLDDAKESLKKRVIAMKRSQVLGKLMQDAESAVKVEILYAPFAAAPKPPMPAPGAAPAVVAPPASAAPPAPPAPPAPEGEKK